MDNGVSFTEVTLHPALRRLADFTANTEFDGALWLVGGAVRDALLSPESASAPADYDVVIGRRDAPADPALSAGRLVESIRPLLEGEPVVYPRFGTAMVRIAGVGIEIVAARRESYRGDSRKPDVEPATLVEDARRRDFTVNALFYSLHRHEVYDPLGGLADLEARLLRTPLDPAATFAEDPLRMLRAVRFVHQLGFSPAPGLFASIRAERARLAIVAIERLQAEFDRMLLLPSADQALADLMSLGLFERLGPELVEMVGVEQGRFHHLDVWEHSLLVVRNLRRTGEPADDRVLVLAALLHDVGKPATRTIDGEGNTRFFSHEVVGAETARAVLVRLRYSNDVVDRVVRLVRGHMRLGSSPTFTDSAARRLLRDFDADLELLLRLVEADAASLRPGLKTLDLDAIRATLEKVAAQAPPDRLTSPLSGEAIMALLDIEGGPLVGKVKRWLQEEVLEGRLEPGDTARAASLVRSRAWE